MNIEGLVNKRWGHFFLPPWSNLLFPLLCTWKVSAQTSVSLPVSAWTPPPAAAAAADVSPALITAAWHHQDWSQAAAGNWSGCLVFLQAEIKSGKKRPVEDQRSRSSLCERKNSSERAAAFSPLERPAQTSASTEPVHREGGESSPGVTQVTQ